MKRYLTINKQLLINKIDQFIEIIEDVEHEYWEKDHFLIDLPGKWELSIYCEIDNQIAGYIIASYKPKSVHIHKLMVRNTCRSKGIGKALLDKFYRRIKNIGKYELITLKVYRDNSRVIDFYKNSGFIIDDESQGLYILSYNINNRVNKYEKIYAVHQPNFIPWAGYFNKIASADVFVILDIAQYPKGSVANRNKIKVAEGELLVTVPISKKVNGSSLFTYQQAIIAKTSWYKKLFRILESYYSKTSYFDQYYNQIRNIFLINSFVDMNITFVKFILKEFLINTEIIVISSLAMDFGKKSELHVNLGKLLNANIYLSGQGARKYNNPTYFAQEGIKLIYQDYNHPIYPQQFPPFVPNLSVLDLLLNCGPEGRKYIFQNNTID